jgi:hypothetical protein
MRIAVGVEGHTRIIGLFGSDWQAIAKEKTWGGCSSRLSTLHHFAIEISLRRYESILGYLTARGLHPNTQTHAWIGWRSIYVSTRMTTPSSSSALDGERLAQDRHAAGAPSHSSDGSGGGRTPSRQGFGEPCRNPGRLCCPRLHSAQPATVVSTPRARFRYARSAAVPATNSPAVSLQFPCKARKIPLLSGSAETACK